MYGTIFKGQEEYLIMVLFLIVFVDIKFHFDSDIYTVNEGDGSISLIIMKQGITDESISVTCGTRDITTFSNGKRQGGNNTCALHMHQTSLALVQKLSVLWESYEN